KKYSEQGFARYLKPNFLGELATRVIRATEAEHPHATAAVNRLLEEAGNRWKRQSPTIVLAEAHSRIKTPTDNQLTRDLKAGNITAQEWLAKSRTNIYRSWFEARMLGIPVPSAEELASAVLEQEIKLKEELVKKHQQQLEALQSVME